MRPQWKVSRRTLFTVASTVIGGAVVLALAARTGVASDHQDTPDVGLHQRLDINDVYVFPGSTPDRIALAVTVASPLTPAQTRGGFTFDAEHLYQLKIDNTGDAVEDLVIQFTFKKNEAGQQIVFMRGPARPNEVGGDNTLLPASAITMQGPVKTVLGSSSGIQLFAGPRDDPFVIDLEQFFRIIPDRKPVTGKLSQLPSTPTATAFRNPGVNFLRELNALAIVVELPESMLLVANTSGDPQIGIWATASR
jgi:hypothetical protein